MSSDQESQEQKKEPGQKTAPRRVELTERDLHTLKWIGEQYAGALDQIARVLGERAGPGVQKPGVLSESATRVWVTRMKAIGAVEQAKPYRAMPGFVWLTHRGLELAELEFRPLEPKPSTLNHIYWCNKARLYMATRRPNDTWRSERYLRSEQAQASKSQRRVPELPDAHLLTQKGVIAIEIELTDKQAGRLVGLLRRRVAEYYTVWYFCSDETKPRLDAAKLELAADVRERVQVYSLSQLE